MINLEKKRPDTFGPVWFQILVGYAILLPTSWLLYRDLFTIEGLHTVWPVYVLALVLQLVSGRPFWTQEWGDAYDYAAICLLAGCATLGFQNALMPTTAPRSSEIIITCDQPCTVEVP